MIEQGDTRSVLTAAQVAEAGTSYDWLSSFDGVLRWVESVPETGRTMVMSWSRSQSGHPQECGQDGESVGSSLHAYGGMPYAVASAGDTLAVNASTGQISGYTETAHSYGDLARYGDELLCVREGDSGDDLVAIDLTSRTSRVVRGTDGLLASPRLWAGRLAWVQWDKNVMPWDSSEVWVADYAPSGQISAALHVAGGPDESAFQPQWGEDGALYFMSDRTGWWNLYRWRDGLTEALAPMVAECATAPWESSYSNYALLPRGRIAITVQRGPIQQLVVVESDGEITPIDLPFTSFKPWLTGLDDRIALIGSSLTRSQEIVLVATDGTNKVEVVRAGSVLNDERPALSVPEVMRVPSADAEVTALFYPPTGRSAPAPLIVRPHAGPTYNSELRLDWEVQFFTSRGFAVADVDYRGSTGYGRAFRKALDGNWGRFDVEDCRAVALHLLATGRALPEAVFISGASAGGYTALRAVCEDGPFALAVARSAIVDPKRWRTTAPRFQQPHAAILSHQSAEVEPDRVRRPVLLIHGDEDAVAPIEDVTKLAVGLQSRKLLVGMLELPGVGHYLSAPEALCAALEAELDAYRSVLMEAGLLTGR